MGVGMGEWGMGEGGVNGAWALSSSADERGVRADDAFTIHRTCHAAHATPHIDAHGHGHGHAGHWWDMDMLGMGKKEREPGSRGEASNATG